MHFINGFTIENPLIKGFPIIKGKHSVDFLQGTRHVLYWKWQFSSRSPPSFYKRKSFYKRMYNRKCFYKRIFYRAQGISLNENSHFLQDRPHPFIKGNPFIKEIKLGNTSIHAFSTGHKAFPFLNSVILFEI